MYIHEAVKKAIEENAMIARSSVYTDVSDLYGIIKPTNTYDNCLLIILWDGEIKRTAANWNPSADDLTADDWIVLRDELGDKIEDAK